MERFISSVHGFTDGVKMKIEAGLPEDHDEKQPLSPTLRHAKALPYRVDKRSTRRF